MPRVNLQKPEPAARQTIYVPPANGVDLLSEMIPVSELIDDWVKLCLYGENRTGKTTVACEFPKPLALLALEPNKSGGAKSVTKIPGVFYKRITTRLETLEFARKLAIDTYFQSVVIDSATSLQDIILTEILGTDVPPEMLLWGMVTEDQYRQRSEQCRETLRPFMNLDKHVIITAKQKDHRRQQGDKRPKMIRGLAAESFFGADLGGATAGWLHDSCDYLCQLYLDKETTITTIPGIVVAGKKQPDSTREVETGRLVRRLRTMYHVNFAAGMRSADPQQVPEYIEAATPREMYNALMQVIRGEYKLKGGTSATK